MSADAPKKVYEFAMKINKDILHPSAADPQVLIGEIREWIEIHRTALLLAWFAQYGFEPGKAVLEERRDLDGWSLRIREATPAEMEEARKLREKRG